LNPSDALGHRVLLRLATAKDGVMTCDVLARAGLQAAACPDMATLIHEMEAGAGALLVAEEVLVETDLAQLAEALRRQPPWSDLPILVLARHGAPSSGLQRVMERLQNVAVIERPVRVATMVSAARSALRSRQRQFEMRRVLADLHDEDRRKNEFLATLAHELRNPLAPLRMTLALLSRGEPQASATRRHYELMERQIDHMVRLIDDLMEISRITRGKVALRFSPVSVKSILDDAVEISRPLLVAGDHVLETRCEDDDLVVRGDPVRLTQIVSNLLNNAAKYTPPGGRILLSARREDGHAVIAVADNGVGIAADMLEAVFDMFVQVSGTSKAAQGGLGIGLTLVRTLVRLHGGSVRATSPGLGRGAVFTVTLPLCIEAPVRPRGAPESEPAETLLANHVVLIVDDNRDAANTVAEVLGAFGASTKVAYDGPTALRLFDDIRFDTALLDIGMPGMDGYELAARLRASTPSAPLTLIALTGYGQDKDLDRMAAAGFDHHVLKPVDFHELLKLI